jgi:uncharacterized protein
MLSKKVGQLFPSYISEQVSPSQRLHLILLGVESVKKSTEFYEALGWIKSATSNDGFTKIDLGGYALCLISREDLARDALYENSKCSGFSGIALVYLAKSPEEVPKILAKAESAGGKIVKPATRTHWGIAGYFSDINGHLFEVDFEEAWVFDQEHRLIVGKVN